MVLSLSSKRVVGSPVVVVVVVVVIMIMSIYNYINTYTILHYTYTSLTPMNTNSITPKHIDKM